MTDWESKGPDNLSRFPAQSDQSLQRPIKVSLSSVEYIDIKQNPWSDKCLS